MATSSEMLLKQQESIGAGLQEIIKLSTRSKVTRQTLPTVMKRLGAVDRDWLVFLRNDCELHQDPSVSANHAYFQDQYRDTVATMVVNITEVISSQVAEVTGVNPRYDLINRGIMGNSRMFGDDGTDLRALNPPGGTNGETTTLSQMNTDPTGGSDIGNSGKATSAGKNPSHNLNSRVREFFENTSNRSFNSNELDGDAQKGVAAMTRALKIVDDALEQCGELLAEGLDAKGIRRAAAFALERWNLAKRLHEGLISRDLDKYDASAFYDYEAQAKHILDKLTDLLMDDDTSKDGGISKKQKSIKMPQIEIPKFDGDYGKWNIFKDLFQQMMDQRELTDAEKFMYLRGNLNGEPLDIIKSLQVTATNYQLAWELLNERYENPRHIIKSMLNKLLFNTERAKSNNSGSLKRIYDAFREGMYAVKIAAKTDEGLLDMIFHQLLLNRMDSTTLGLYEQTLDNDKQPTSVAVLLKFVAKRFRALEYSVDDSSSKNNQPQVNHKHFGNKQKTTALTVATTSQQVKVCSCKDQHSITKCPKFTKLSVEERYKLAKRAAVCLQCLKPGHAYKQCTGKPCFTCNKHHHTLLHFARQEASAHLGSTVKVVGIDHVFLGTAIIYVMSADGVPIKMRALLDSGAQLSIMSEAMLRKTGMNTTPANMEVIGLGELLASSNKRTTINIASMHSSYETSLEVFIMKKVTTCQPLRRVETSKWGISKDIQLADPAFNIPDKIDILIGAELFYRLMDNGMIKLGKGLLDLQNTVFGWIVIGRLLGLETNRAFAGLGISNSDSTLQKQLERFWQVEERGTSENVNLTDEELQCEISYERTTVRQSNGRFVVNLQFTKEPSMLGSSHDMAIRRFLTLERRFERDQQLKKEYCKFMQEYIDLGHMEKVDKPGRHDPCYIIPHHSVLNPESSTTKFRVVFDASAKTSSNISLNDIMSNGPMLQQDLFSIMARFRIWSYVFSADISKMYRQILITKDEQRWQMIVWRNDQSKELEYYKLKTVTYGTKCASYLAIKSLQSLADIEETNYPLASVIARRDFNVDDVMTGSNDLQEAIVCQSQLIEMMKKGKFDLHKWCANHPALFDQIPEKKRAISLDINGDITETKALGMKWIPHSDIFSLKYQPKEHSKITKRTVLSETAQLFDPLGLVNPVIMKAKVFIQELWSEKMDWDTVLSPENQQRWIKYRNQLPEVENFEVPRHVVMENAINVQLHIFSDASELAYGAVVYVRSTTSEGQVKIQLLCSKSRVAPAGKMKISLPRLELCGAAVATDLAKKVQSIIGIETHGVKFWTDSEIVLSWLYNDIPLKTFVANRVNHVKRNTNVNDWKHIDSKNNPADIVSRGASVSELKNNQLWWSGPEFLKKPEEEWPQSKPEFARDPSEEKTIKSILTATAIEDDVVRTVNHRNSINRWQRILAYCIKFLEREKEDNLILGLLSKTHLKKALIAILKYAQGTAFGQDIHWIKQSQPEKTAFKTMTPILDADGVLRVGGRLQNSTLSFEQRHPAILPYRHEVTKMIMHQAHMDNKHAGPQALLGIVRQQYWPIKGKIMAKSIVDNCVLCARTKPKLFQQLMGNLPKERVTSGRCFLNTGIDFAGPIIIHYNGRGVKTTKAYICVFVCFSTKAVHLEVAADQSMPAFLRCLKRFIARRGIPQKIYSDNAGNFKATNKHLVELGELMESNQFNSQVAAYCGSHNIEWRFIPPRSPHFGAIWESAVKSAKHLLTKVLHNHRLTYEELSTALAEIEAILNSRPLSSMSNDPNDLQPLTAGHFLTGAPLRSINDSKLVTTSKTKQWAHLVEIRNDFWKRWSREYLCELQYKKKWRTLQPNAIVGTLVMLKDQNLPPLQWRIGRITELMPDKDGIVRVVYVKTASGMFTRAIHELAPLPSADEDDNDRKNSLPETPNKSTLNVEAPEFEWNLNQLNPDIPPVNKEKVVKQVKQVEKRKKKVSFTPVDDTPRTTRSGRLFGLPQFMATALIGLLLLTVVEGAQPCNTTKFLNNPGIFFEKMGQLSLTNTEWTIVCHLNMSDYWHQATAMNILLQHLKTVCPHVHPEEHCGVVYDQLRSQLDKINEKNALITSFTNIRQKQRSTRGLRKKRNFFGERKNGGWISGLGIVTQKLFGRMNEIQKHTIETAFQQLNQPNHLRQKRGWFDGVGKGAKEVFGILNDDDAKYYDGEIKNLKSNEDYLKQLIYNQTLIQEITTNVIRNNNKSMQKQLAYLNKTVQGLMDKDETGKMHLFNTISLQTLSMITSYHETQDAVISMLTSVFHGKIPPTVISPLQLQRLLRIITDNIDTNLMVPGDDQRGQISQLYTMLSAKVSVTSENLIIKINIPLISREYYHLYHVVPVPFIYEGDLHTVVPSTEYIAVNLKQDHFYMLTAEDKKACKVFEDDRLICNQLKPLFNVQNDKQQCEISVLLNPATAHTKCKIIQLNLYQAWTALAAENNYLYSVKDPLEISIICNVNTKHCSLTDSGMITIPKHCMIKSGSIEMTARNIIIGAIEPILLIAPTNISHNMPSRQSPPNNVENWEEIVDNSDLDVLTNAIIHQREKSSIQFANSHDIHHYTISYTLLCAMLIAITVYVWRVRPQCWCKKRTWAIKKSTAVDIPMQEIKEEEETYSRPFARARFLGESA